MAKTMEIFKSVVLALMLVPLICASRVEELERKNEKLEQKNDKLEAELEQLKEMFSTLQAQMEANILDVTDKLAMKVDVNDFVVRLNDTEELEARVMVLEESMEEVQEDVTVLQTGLVTLADEVDDVESVNILQEETINTLEAEILDNDNDIEELVDITTGLTTQVSSLEEDVVELDERVGDLESGGGSGNMTDLEERVDSLEEVTSQLSDVTAALNVRVSDTEEEIVSLDQRVEDLESGSGNINITDYGDTAFLAALSASTTSTQEPLTFDWEVINPGGHYNNETGQYTALYDGIYQFSVHLTNNDVSSVDLFFNIAVDDSELGSHDDAYNDDHYRSTTILLELQAGQTVHIHAGTGVYGTSTYLRSYFSGYMISAN